MKKACCSCHSPPTSDSEITSVLYVTRSFIFIFNKLVTFGRDVSFVAKIKKYSKLSDIVRIVELVQHVQVLHGKER